MLFLHPEMARFFFSLERQLVKCAYQKDSMSQFGALSNLLVFNLQEQKIRPHLNLEAVVRR